MLPSWLISGYSCSKRGFTLIELLVVVLIIGILAAVALPQYQKVVEKSKSVQGIALVKAFGQAARAYYLTHGTNPTSLDQLDVALSERQTAEFVCQHGITDSCDTKEWGISLYESSNHSAGILVWRTSGPYKGGGFIMYYDTGSSATLSTDSLYCMERTVGPNAIATTGAYCRSIMKVGISHVGVNNMNHFIMN